MPVPPIVVAVIGHGDAVVGRVVDPDDGTGPRGGAVAGGRELIDVKGLPALLGQLEAGGRANDAGANYDCIVTLAHGLVPLPLAAHPRARSLEPSGQKVARKIAHGKADAG